MMRGTMARPNALPTLTLFLSCLLAGLPLPASAEIVLGVAGPMTGVFRPVGEAIAGGATAAAERINAAGGIAGEPIRVEVVDDKCEARTAEAVANQLVGMGAAFVVGHACAGAAIPAARVYAERGLPLISPAVTNPRFTDERIGPGVFRLAPRADAQPERLGAFLVDQYRTARVGFAADGSVYGRLIVDGARTALEAAGGRAVFNETFTPGEKSQINLTGKVQDAALDVLVVGGSDADAAVIASDLKARGLSTQVVGGDTLGLQGFKDAAGPAAEGVVFTLPADHAALPAAAEAVDALTAAGTGPTPVALAAYAAVEILAQALAQQPASPDEAIRAGTFSTALGPVRFDDKGDAEIPGFSLFTWRGEALQPFP